MEPIGEPMGKIKMNELVLYAYFHEITVSFVYYSGQEPPPILKKKKSPVVQWFFPYKKKTMAKVHAIIAKGHGKSLQQPRRWIHLYRKVYSALWPHPGILSFSGRVEEASPKFRKFYQSWSGGQISQRFSENFGQRFPKTHQDFSKTLQNFWTKRKFFARVTAYIIFRT